MKLSFFGRTVLLTLLTQGAVCESLAGIIIDTGAPNNISTGFPLTTSPDNSGFHWFAGQFTMKTRFLFTGAEGWIGNYAETPGTINLSVTKDAGGIPGESIFTQSFTVPGEPFGYAQWYGISEEYVFLKAGTYWITFAPQAGTVNTFMPVGAPDPLDNYAFWNSANSETWVNENFNLGLRVSGNIPIAPEPSFYGTIASALLGGLVLWRRWARSKPNGISAVLRVSKRPEPA